MSDEQVPQDPEHEKKLLELNRATALADAEKKKLEAEKNKLDAQKALDSRRAQDALDAEKSAKELADKQKERIESERALERARKPPDESAEKADAAKKQADSRKAVADAEKSEADASKAKSEAELAAFKARFGEVPESPYKGEVTLKDNAGKAEAFLLAAQAVRSAAAAIVKEIEGVQGREVVVIATTDVPTFDNLTRFQVEIGIVEKAFDGAHSKSEKSEKAAEDMEEKLAQTAGQLDKPGREPQKPKVVRAAAPVAGAAGLALQAADKLLGFFRTDYTVGGVEVTVEDATLVNDLAGRLAKMNFTVYLPKLFSSHALEQAREDIVGSLQGLAVRRTRSESTARQLEETAAKWTKRAEEERNDERKEEMTAVAEAHEEAVTEVRNASELYDRWFEKLLTADDKTSVIPIASVVRERALMDTLRNGKSLLAVKLHGASGSFYTKKNIWTVFGRMPFFHMGGTVASYALLDGTTGAVKAAGTVPVHGGFFKSTRLANEIAKRPGPPTPKRSWWQTVFGTRAAS